MGFAAAGVCGARASDRSAEFRAWLDAGKNGSMEFLAQTVEARLNVESLLPGARSVIMVADLYAGRDDPPEAPGVAGDRPLGRIARYARGRDYHAVIKHRLYRLRFALAERFPEAGFEVCVDLKPTMDREHAVRAGLGWVGKHTLVISPTLGSWFVLGALVTTLELPELPERRVEPDHCGTCTRCIDACPTGAITPYSVDASRCISYLTIERRLPIDAGFHEALGAWAFGCDVCQDVCPHNSPRAGAGRANPAYESRRESLDLLDVLEWSEEDRQREIAGSAIKRATLDMLKRNAVIVLGNLVENAEPGHTANHSVILERLRRAAGESEASELVRQTARAVLDRLNDPPGR